MFFKGIRTHFLFSCLSADKFSIEKEKTIFMLSIGAKRSLFTCLLARKSGCEGVGKASEIVVQGLTAAGLMERGPITK